MLRLVDCMTRRARRACVLCAVCDLVPAVVLGVATMGLLFQSFHLLAPPSPLRLSALPSLQTCTYSVPSLPPHSIPRLHSVCGCCNCGVRLDSFCTCLRWFVYPCLSLILQPMHSLCLSTYAHSCSLALGIKKFATRAVLWVHSSWTGFKPMAESLRTRCDSRYFYSVRGLSCKIVCTSRVFVFRDVLVCVCCAAVSVYAESVCL